MNHREEHPHLMNLFNCVYNQNRGGLFFISHRLFKNRNSNRNNNYMNMPIKHRNMNNRLKRKDSLNSDSKELKKSIEFYTQSYEMFNRIYGNKHSIIATILNSLGNVYELIGDLDKALNFYLKSLEIREVLYKNEIHPDLAKSFNDIGNIYEKLNDSNKSLIYFFKAYEIWKKISEDNLIYNKDYVRF